MPESFEVASADGPYVVEVRDGLFEEALKNNDAVILCDDRFAPPIAKRGIKHISIVAEETSKSLDAMTDVIVKLRQLGVTRKSHLTVVGGGTVQDAGAFAAAIYMRGLRYSYLPTTLLGMADSCIGGKSSINVGHYKNLVGTIEPPEKVLIDPSFIRELPALQRAAGLCEAAKICFVRGAESFASYLAEHPSVDLPIAGLERVIHHSLMAKKWFVEIDEFDQKERLLLNFGHTFGHALEGVSNFGISHGIAVGLGILCAIDAGKRLGRDYGKIERVGQLHRHVQQLVSTDRNLVKVFAGITAGDACRYFIADKKHGPDYFTLILIDEAGKVERATLPKGTDTLSLCERSFESIINTYVQ